MNNMEIGRVRRGNALTQEIKMSGNKKDFSQSFQVLNELGLEK